jgi:hypothetical protein
MGIGEEGKEEGYPVVAEFDDIVPSTLVHVTKHGCIRSAKAIATTSPPNLPVYHPSQSISPGFETTFQYGN